MVSEVTYSTDEYLMLLNTYSPYLKLDPQPKDALFTGLRNSIERDFGGSLQLSHISAFHKFDKTSRFALTCHPGRGSGDHSLFKHFFDSEQIEGSRDFLENGVVAPVDDWLKPIFVMRQKLVGNIGRWVIPSKRIEATGIPSR
jgi:hypothetical protein